MQAAVWQFFFGEFSCVSDYISVVESASDDLVHYYTKSYKIEIGCIILPYFSI